MELVSHFSIFNCEEYKLLWAKTALEKALRIFKVFSGKGKQHAFKFFS